MNPSGSGSPHGRQPKRKCRVARGVVDHHERLPRSGTLERVVPERPAASPVARDRHFAVALPGHVHCHLCPRCVDLLLSKAVARRSVWHIGLRFEPRQQVRECLLDCRMIRQNFAESVLISQSNSTMASARHNLTVTFGIDASTPRYCRDPRRGVDYHQRLADQERSKPSIPSGLPSWGRPGSALLAP